MAGDERPDRAALWAAVAAERRRLVEDLSALDETDWGRASLCGRWTVEDVMAHLTAAASVGRFAWLRSVVGARFDFDLHNERRLAEHRGATPAATLDGFRAVVASTTAASGATAAWLGEVVRGPVLALTMVMAGRDAYLPDLDGPGVPTLRARLQPTA